MKKFILIIIIFIISTGCSEKKTAPSTLDIFAMDTYMNLKAYGENSENALKNSYDEILRLEKLFSVTNPESEISSINNAGGKPVRISSDVRNAVETAIMIGNQTEGKLDITVYPILKVWGFTTGNYKIPEKEKINQLLKNTGYQKISLEENTITIPRDFQIDLGSVAKGYTADRIKEIFMQNNIKCGAFSLGGNVQTIGIKPDGSLWKTAVVNPFSPDSSLGILEITDKAVITSGSYERYFKGSDGKEYCHIIDPENGYPVKNDIMSVTVIGESGIICDALSTALFIYGKENALEYWKEYKNFDMIIVTDKKEILITEGIKDCFENKSNFKTEIIYL